MNPEYLLQIQVKNNCLLGAMRDEGVQSVAELSRLLGVSQTNLGKVANLRESVYLQNGDVRKVYKKLADYFGLSPEELCPNDLHYQGLDKNKAERELTRDQVSRLTNISEQSTPDALVESQQLLGVLDGAIEKLLPREQEIIDLRFTQELTFEDIGKVMGITRERVRQVEAKALNKLRHPTSGLSESLGIDS